MKFRNIPYGKQYIDKKDIKIVNNALKQNLITTGNFVKEFEKRFKKFFKSKYTLACSSGTAALHLSFLSTEIQPGDNVVVPSINFVAAANLLKLIGANVYFCDIDADTFQISSKTLLECIKYYKLRKIKAVVLSYIGGYPSLDKELIKIKKKYKFYLIEDACHALGSTYKINNQVHKVGSSKYTDISTFSLHPVKTITSGEGGIISTNNKKLYEKIKKLRSHGIDRKKFYWEYEIGDSGLNYRLSDINCALAISQLSKINKFVKKRGEIANKYNQDLIENRELLLKPKIRKNQLLSWHLYIIRIKFKKLSITRNFFIKCLNKKKIYPQIHYIPTYRFNKFKLKNKKNFEETEAYFKECLSLPIYYRLTLVEQNYIIKNINNLILKYIKH